MCSDVHGSFFCIWNHKVIYVQKYSCSAKGCIFAECHGPGPDDVMRPVTVYDQARPAWLFHQSVLISAFLKKNFIASGHKTQGE